MVIFFHQNVVSPHALDVKDPSSSKSAVWHWHGYKAQQVRCMFDQIRNGSWDVNTPEGILVSIEHWIGG